MGKISNQELFGLIDAAYNSLPDHDQSSQLGQAILKAAQNLNHGMDSITCCVKLIHDFSTYILIDQHIKNIKFTPEVKHLYQVANKIAQKRIAESGFANLGNLFLR